MKPMSERCWQATFRQTLARLATPDHRPRIALVGVGQELCGDDGAGIAVARRLMDSSPVVPDLLVLDAGPAPENTSGALRQFRPDLVLLVDAAAMGVSPGSVRWLDWRQTVGIRASTHTLPLHILSSYLTAELGCEVALLGIQPASLSGEDRLSTPVEAAVDSIARAIRGLFAAQQGVGMQ
jgi:hydrogenase 3 maturation protease